tara:strand:+ start:1092 stop:1928 length:837 start_codon:yes stop_codon:yes gene_type:complete
MPSFTGNKFSNFYKRILQINQSSNTGVDTTTRNIQDGDGGSTVASISDDQLLVKPINDDTTTTLAVQDSGGNNRLTVDTTNDLVKVGASQVSATTQYAHFGMIGQSADYGNMVEDTHYALPFGGMGTNFGLENVSYFAMGSSTSSSFNDTNPATSLTISTNLSGALVATYWHIRDNITIDEVTWLHGADAATGDSTAAHLMAYTVDTGNGATSGDLSSGVVVADGATITNAGYGRIYYQQMTIQSANVDAGKVILFIFASDTVNSDYGVNATIKYHIR